MRYTRSKDGIDRVNLRAVIRVDKEEVARIRAMAKKQERSLSQYLTDCVYAGLQADAHNRDYDSDEDDGR